MGIANNGDKCSGWTIFAKLETDYYVWIEKFSATHPEFGEIEGDLKKSITANSQEAYDHFISNHSLKEFDLWDI